MIVLPLLLAEPALPCRADARLPVLVRISGFRSRSGRVRVRLFGGAPSTWFDKRHALVRVEAPVPARGPVEICVAAPRAGGYAVDVRHDGNANGRTDRGDGGGASGNPRLSLVDLLLGRKPPPAAVRFRVDGGVTVVPVTLQYLQGGRFRPVKDAR